MEFVFKSPLTPHPSSYEQIPNADLFCAHVVKKRNNFKQKYSQITSEYPGCPLKTGMPLSTRLYNPSHWEDIIIVIFIFSLSKRKTSDSAKNVCWFFMSEQLRTVFCGRVWIIKTERRQAINKSYFLPIFSTTSGVTICAMPSFSFQVFCWIPFYLENEKQKSAQMSYSISREKTT